MPVELAVPRWWDWTLLVPSLAALIVLLARGLRSEAPAPPPARWTAVHLAAAVLIHVLAQAAAMVAFDIPFLPASLAAGGATMLVGAITCLAVLWITRASGSSWAALGLLPPRRLRNAAAVAAAYLAFIAPLGIVVGAWDRLLSSLGHVPILQPALALYIEARRHEEWAGMAVLVAGAVVVAPVAEELLFRGLVFGVLRTLLGTPAAVFGASALFAAFHFYPEVLVPIFLFGVVLNLVYVRTGSLAYAILLHLIFNGGTLLWTGLGGG